MGISNLFPIICGKKDGMGTLLLLTLFNISESLRHAQFLCMDVIIPCTLAMGVYLHLCREST